MKYDKSTLKKIKKYGSITILTLLAIITISIISSTGKNYDPYEDLQTAEDLLVLSKQTVKDMESKLDYYDLIMGAKKEDSTSRYVIYKTHKALVNSSRTNYDEAKSEFDRITEGIESGQINKTKAKNKIREQNIHTKNSFL